jgi:predicted transcriptional regulator YheO
VGEPLDDPAPGGWAEPYSAAAEAVVRLFYPHVEAVIHDIGQDVVVRIWNPISGRRPGDASLLDPSLLGELTDGGVAGPYRQAGLRGAEISSVSAVIAAGRGLLCLNFDRSVISSAVAGLRAFALGVEPRPAGLFERDWREDLNAMVGDWCQERGLRPTRLSREDRRRLVAFLDGRGAFEIRRAASHLAEIVGVSRATVYAALQQSRAGADDAA